MRPWCARDSALALGLAVLLPCFAAQADDGLAPITVDRSAFNQPREVQLAVSVNGTDLRLIEPFTFYPVNGRLSIGRADLREIGVKVAEGNDAVFLDQIAKLTFHYDDAHQSVALTLPDALRLPRIYGARNPQKPIEPTSDIGFLVNYALFAGSVEDMSRWKFGFSGANASLDAHLFSPVGVLNQSGIVGTTTFSDASALRLESDYTYSDRDHALTYRAGDTIAGGLAWTRPIRMAGLQVQRDFTLRSDLVTAPLPQISGTAAVPSSVDVFVNGTKAYSQDVAPGPYSLTSLPLMAQNGVAQVVVRDATGREVDTNLNLFDPGRLLAPGLADFSVESGFARVNYGSVSDGYNRDPIASASLRAGFSDWFTGEAHAEAAESLANAGAGALTRFGPYGILTTALSASRHGSDVGLQAYGSYEWQSRGFSIQIGSQRTFGTYLDLASMTERLGPGILSAVGAGSSVTAAGLISAAAVRPPKALDRASIGAPLPFGKGTVNIGTIDLRDADGKRSRIATASLSYSLPCDASLFVTGFKDFANGKASGIYAGLSMPLGDGISVAAGYSARAGSQGFTTAAQKSQPHQDGTYGWRVDDTEGADPVRQVAGTYRTGYGQIGASIQQTGRSANGQAQFDGAIAVMKDGVAVGNRSDQSFVVVDTGVPGVPVLQDNRPVGATNALGKYLVPDLRPYERNKISIDPSSLPASADASRTDAVIAPPAHGGALVDFAISANAPAAIVVLEGVDGKSLAAGLKGRRDGGESFVVGYDGRAYIKGLEAANTVIVDTGAAECRASFAYGSIPGKQAFIDHVVCR